MDSKTRPLTIRQQQILNYIYWVRAFEHTFTLRNAAAHFGVGLHTMWEHLWFIRKKGMLKWQKRKSCTVVLTERGRVHANRVVQVDPDVVAQLGRACLSQEHHA